MRTIARVLLALATFVLLLSMGGGMLYGWWVLVPLHWLAARDASPVGTMWWAFLAAASLGEVTWMVGYVLTGDDVLPTLGAAAVAAATIWAFLGARLRRIPVS